MNYKRGKCSRHPGGCKCCSVRWFGNRKGRHSDKDQVRAEEFKAFKTRNKIAS